MVIALRKRKVRMQNDGITECADVLPDNIEAGTRDYPGS